MAPPPSSQVAPAFKGQQCPLHSVAHSSSLGPSNQRRPPPPPWGRRIRYRPAARLCAGPDEFGAPLLLPWGLRKQQRLPSSSLEPLRKIVAPRPCDARARRVRSPSPPPWGLRKARRLLSSSPEPLRPPNRAQACAWCPIGSAALSSSLAPPELAAVPLLLPRDRRPPLPFSPLKMPGPGQGAQGRAKGLARSGTNRLQHWPVSAGQNQKGRRKCRPF